MPPTNLLSFVVAAPVTSGRVLSHRCRLPALALILTLAAAGAAAANAPVQPTAVRIHLPGGKPTPAAQIAVDRLQDYGGFKTEPVYGPFTASDAGSPGLRILLGTAQDAPEFQRQWSAHSSPRADAYLIKTISTRPLVVMASGMNPRGTLYAAYHLADLLRAQADLTAVNVFRQPRIAERFVSFGATTHSRRNYNPALHWKTLNELPGFGYNGLIIYPGGGTPIGRQSSPIMETKQGDLFLDPENTRQWKAWFSDLQKYHLDLMMTIPPIIPPGYTSQEIRGYYAGGPEPKGYLPALQAHFRHYLELLTKTYPEPTKYMFNSTEGATFGRNARFFVEPDAKYSNQTYLENNDKVMTAYFDVLTDVFESDLSRVYFWTHTFGLTSEGIVRMREVLFRYPAVTIIEDDFWNNNLWPMDLPAMAYLPPDLRKRVSERNPFALFQIATDGEYYGGGSIPNAYAGSHIRTAREALARKARMVIQRLDLHDATPYGTAFATMKIVPYAASKQLWEPTPSEAEIWDEWAASRFGRRAAPYVINALQESRTVLIDGLSVNGIDLLAVGSQFNPRLWIRDGSGLSRFYLFGKPGERFVKKKPGDIIYSPEYTAWQMNTRSIPIQEFRKNQEKARQAVQRGLEEIEIARPHLTPADHEMLRGVFLHGAAVLKTVRLLGEAAYATNLMLENFDQVENPKLLHDTALAALEGHLKEATLTPGMIQNLERIVTNYKSVP